MAAVATAAYKPKRRTEDGRTVRWGTDRCAAVASVPERLTVACAMRLPLPYRPAASQRSVVRTTRKATMTAEATTWSPMFWNIAALPTLAVPLAVIQYRITATIPTRAEPIATGSHQPVALNIPRQLARSRRR